MDISIFLGIIGLPLWSVIAIALAGVVVGMFFLTLAILLLGRNSDAKEASAQVPETRETRTAASDPELRREVAPDVKTEPVVVSTKQHQPITSIRQHYWYYVSGVAGRFATLRDALSASGVKVPGDKMLDWKKLPVDTRAKIKRVDVNDEQPVPEQAAVRPVVAHREEVPVETKREGKAYGGAESVVRKPIGNGAFVTIAKKRGL